MGKLIFIDQWLSERRMEEIITGSVHLTRPVLKWRDLIPDNNKSAASGPFRIVTKGRVLPTGEKALVVFLSEYFFSFCMEYIFLVPEQVVLKYTGPFTL